MLNAMPVSRTLDGMLDPGNDERESIFLLKSADCAALLHLGK